MHRAMMPFKRVLPYVTVIVVFATVCRGGSPKEAVADAVKNQPDAKAFARLFPQADHFISYYTGKMGPRTWNSRVLLHERYVLTMQFDAALDPSGNKVTATSAPKYHLSEVTEVTVAASGQVSISYGDSLAFGPKEGKKLEGAKGDLAAIGIKVNANQPVPNLKAHWRDG